VTDNSTTGRLLHGNASGDPSKAPRCGAKTRRGGRCKEWSAADARGGNMASDRQPQLPNASTAQRKHDKPGKNCGTSKCCCVCTADLRQGDPDALCRPEPGSSEFKRLDSQLSVGPCRASLSGHSQPGPIALRPPHGPQPSIPAIRLDPDLAHIRHYTHADGIAPGRCLPRIRTVRARSGSAPVTVSPARVHGRQLVLEVSDNGCGFERWDHDDGRAEGIDRWCARLSPLARIRLGGGSAAENWQRPPRCGYFEPLLCLHRTKSGLKGLTCAVAG